MLPRKSRLAAQPTERPFLAPFWLIMLLGGIVTIGLILIYPQRDLIRRISEAPESQLSSAYLSNLLRGDPNNPQLRLLLARQQLHQGEMAQARATLQPALNSTDTALRHDVLWLMWQVTEAEYNRLPAQPEAAHQLLKEELRTRLRELSRQSWPEKVSLQLANKAFELGERELGLQLYKQLAGQTSDRAQAARLYEKAAREGLAFSNYRATAELYILARQATTDPRLARQYFHAALRALQSGNPLAAALELGEKELGDLADDEETLLLLTQIARAGGRPDIADRYVRRLLKISLLRQWQAIQIARAWGEGNFQKVSSRTPSAEPGIPFDDKIYSLGFEVFLENRKLEDAWQVAAAAVRQVPANIVWRERLARVSEWSGRAEIALDNWLILAKQSQNDAAWQAVLRLAPGLFNDPALISALHYQLGRQPGNQSLLKELIAAYERNGDPQSALDYLARRTSSNTTPETLELTAELADRAGQPETAIKAWLRLFQTESEITTPRAVKLAVLLMLQGRGEEGLHWLVRAQSRAGHETAADLEFWRLTGQLAQLQQNDAQAIRAFTQLTGSGKAEMSDFDSLIQLLADTHPSEAARVAAEAWARFDQPQHLIRALNLYITRNQWAAMGALFKQLDSSPQATRHAFGPFRRNPEFLRLIGTYHQNMGNLAQARLDFEGALKLAPDSAAIQQALLWLFIDSNDATSLRRLLASREQAWRTDPAMHDTLASAYQALSLPQVALERYLSPRTREHKNDFLWLMNYADALDQNQQTDRAWRLRRLLLSREWQETARASQPGKAQPTLLEVRQRFLTEPELAEVRRIARTRLLLTQRPGDIALDALRELLRLDRDAERIYSNAAAEMAIGWLQDAGEYNAERGFLFHQYARSQSKLANRPLWAEITVALAEDDKAATGQLLETFDESLPRYDRINAARAVDDLRRVQSAAFDTQSNQTDDDPLHMQLSDSLLEFSDHAGLERASQKLGGLDEVSTIASLHAAVDPRLSLDFKFGQLGRKGTDAAVLQNPPDERFTSLRINWRHLDGETTLMAEKRHSLESYTPLQVEHEQRIDNRLSLRLGLGTDLPSQETTILRVAGKKDRASLGLSYRPTRMDLISLEHWREDYSLQTGTAVGRGNHTGITLSHMLRQEARDLEVSAFWSTHRYGHKADAEGIRQKDSAVGALMPIQLPPPDNIDIAPDYFLPDNFNFYGIRLATDVRYETQYTRAIRPFGSVSATRHSNLGSGYDLRLGIAGSVLGADHLSLSWGLGKSGPQSGSLARELQLNYRMHY
jgi:polysaccharide biosynthesis protein PelB